MPFSIRPFRRFPVQRTVRYHAELSLLIAVLLLNVGPAYAEWVPLGTTDDGMTAYVDLDTIHRQGQFVKLWELYDFKTIQAGPDSYLSIKIQHEYDCAVERMRLLALTEFSGNMGNGKLLFTHSDEQSWHPAQPDSIGQTMWTFACSKE